MFDLRGQTITAFRSEDTKTVKKAIQRRNSKCREKIPKLRAAGDREKRMVPAGDAAVVQLRDRAAIAYAPIAERKSPISGAYPVTGSNAPSVEKPWFGNRWRFLTSGQVTMGPIDERSDTWLLRF